MTNKKIILMSFCFVLAIGILTGCTNTEEELIETEIENTTMTDAPEYSDAVINEDLKNIEITISDKCVGCGRCAGIAPDNFQIDGDIAIVKSQTITDLEIVKMAKENCPVDAIDLS